jgi:hypothetical protein
MARPCPSGEKTRRLTDTAGSRDFRPLAESQVVTASPGPQAAIDFPSGEIATK